MSYSWFRVWRVGPVVLSMVACGSDQGSTNNGVTCGEGTVLKDDKCIPQCGAGTVLKDGQCIVGGSAGSANQGGGANRAGSAGRNDAEAGSAGESEADAGSAGESQTNGGSAGSGLAGSGGTGGSSVAGNGGIGGSGLASSGGMGGSNIGGSAGSGIAGNDGSAGSGYSGSGGSGVAGSAGAGPMGHPQWLIISQANEGLSAYDLKTFPTASAVSIEASPSIRATTLSPDGHWLLYAKGYDVYCRDMTGAAPGSPLLVATSVPVTLGSTGLTWSADAKSAAVVASGSSTSTMVEVFDPTRPAPLLRVLSTAINAFRWAPGGDRLMYADSSGTHVRRIQSGVPSADFLLDTTQYPNSFTWAPDGQAAVTFASNKLTWTDLTQATPALVTLSTPSVASPTVINVAFSPDSTSLLFSGVQIRDGARDLFKVTLKPSIGAPVRVSTGLTGTATVNGFSLSPDGKWAIYTLGDSTTPTPATYWAVDVSGTNPGTPVQIPILPNNSAAWVPNASGKFLGSYNGGISMVDVSNGASNPLSGVTANVVFGPVGAMVAYSLDSHLFVRDLDHPEAPIGDVALLSTNGVNTRGWSPDGKFIAATEAGSSAWLRLVRLEGTIPSTAVPILSGSTPNLIWQPLSN